MSAVPKEIHDAIPLRRRNTSCSSFSSAATAAIAHAVAEKDFAITAITAAVTEALVVRRGTLSGTILIPVR